MSYGSERSRTSLESDSEAEDAHPVDAVIQAAISRQQSPASDVDCQSRAIKRKRETSPQRDSISLRSSSDKASGKSKRHGVRQDQASPAKTIPAAENTPIGVTVVEEGAQTRNAEVQRLLRGGRQVPHLEFAVIKLDKFGSMLQPYKAQTDAQARKRCVMRS